MATELMSLGSNLYDAKNLDLSHKNSTVHNLIRWKDRTLIMRAEFYNSTGLIYMFE